MYPKVFGRFSPIVLPIILISIHAESYGIAAYIPQSLKECITIVHEMAERNDNAHNLAELYAMIDENRSLTSDRMVRGAIKEAFNILENNKDRASNKRQYKAITTYFQQYLNNLDDSSILLAVQGNKAQLTSFPQSLIARSMNESLLARDMICLSSELAFAQNLQLCGNVDLDGFIQTNVAKRKKVVTASKRDDAFDDVDACPINLPSIIFGTGVASPIVNAWTMYPSDLIQYPVNMEFSILGYLHPKKAITLELHFLVKQHAAPNGTARIRINGMYTSADNDGVIDNADSIFMYTTDSHDFLVTEQLATSNSLRHICVNVRLEKALFKKYNSASLSLTRIEPTSGVEYADDLYLVAAVLRYAAE